MKLTPLLALLAALSFVVGCGSTSETADGTSAKESQPMGDNAEDPSTANTSDEGPLMDQYLSGEIPGFDDEQ